MRLTLSRLVRLSISLSTKHRTFEKNATHKSLEKYAKFNPRPVSLQDLTEFGKHHLIFSWPVSGGGWVVLCLIYNLTLTSINICMTTWSENWFIPDSYPRPLHRRQQNILEYFRIIPVFKTKP